MEHKKQVSEELLLDFHLDRLTDEDCSWIEAELRRDADLRGISDRLGRVLQPLDHARPGPVPASLAENVLAYIARSTDPLLPIPFPTNSRDRSRSPFLHMRELIAVAACILLLVGVAVPGVSELRGRSQRALCANNLSSIFQGASAYQQAFGDSLPFAGGVAAASWLPGGEGGAPYASNSRHPYLLVKLNYGPKPKDFICPGSSIAEAMPTDQVAAHDDFGAARNISYDSLNLAGASPNLRPPVAIAYISDANPLFVGARFNDAVDPSCTNSAAHGGRGQSVLTLNGTVQFVRSPIYDATRDNLWTIGDVRRYRGTESTTRNDDAFLVPGYPITDPMIRASYKH
jgi:hypothetical protein